jgi:hypothetical protein
MSIDSSLAAKRDEVHFLFFAGFEADGRSGGDIEAHAARGGAVEFESGVHFEKMIVTADLNGTVASVANYQGTYRPAGVQFNFRTIEQELTRMHALSY